MKDKINFFLRLIYEHFINRALNFNLILIFKESLLYFDIDI